MAVPFGIAFVWLGYAALYYGFNRITGGNDHFIDLIYPGRYHPVTRDNGSGGSGSSASSAASSAAAAAKPKPVVPSAAAPVKTGNVRTVGHA